MNVFEKLQQSFSQNLPFVVYRNPKKNNISGFFMNDDCLFYADSFTESGFVFAPFNEKEKSILFPIEKSEFTSEYLQFDDVIYNEEKLSVNDKFRENHIQIVEKTIEKINTSDLKKIVISRKEKVQLSSFDLLIVYKKLLQNYKNAFVYVWFHPKVGLWLGATPEMLLHFNNSSFKTMSLAGTQVYDNTRETVWKSKEIEEQELVTDFIKTQIKEISSNLKIDKTETIRAGNLLHLRTKVEGELNSKSNLKSLIRALHPTPAVCGLPRKKSKNFILENEGYNRRFYTGFLGELNLQNLGNQIKNSKLYVNLRCMEIENNIAAIYVGGGITKDSNPLKEWEETVSKTKTMKKVL